MRIHVLQHTTNKGTGEITVNDDSYPFDQNSLKQTAEEIIDHGVPEANRDFLYRILDYIAE
ncbi:MAG: hypothetical protein Q3959_01545 [Limosilactobacillus sp.]|uniref:hypothetical protein n=1 Tax=Limosilactobacillus sp. TaxID=2773925 RepID=UPI0026FF36DC|nr:hypothetical protein [Limosilactobacillus sp.]